MVPPLTILLSVNLLSTQRPAVQKPGWAINNHNICKANQLIKNGDYFSLQPQQKFHHRRVKTLGCEWGSSKRDTCRAKRRTPSLFSARFPPKEENGFSIRSCRFPVFPILSQDDYIYWHCQISGEFASEQYLLAEIKLCGRDLGSGFFICLFNCITLLSLYFLYHPGGPCFALLLLPLFRAPPFFWCAAFL